MERTSLMELRKGIDFAFRDFSRSYGDSIEALNGTAIGTGYENTINIENGCNTIGTAADICANLDLEGYDDWFLPSKNELAAMFWNLHKKGLGGFGNSRYWSSSEQCYNSEYSVYYYDFSFTPSTYQIWDFVTLKGDFLFVRPARAF